MELEAGAVVLAGVAGLASSVAGLAGPGPGVAGGSTLGLSTHPQLVGVSSASLVVPPSLSQVVAVNGLQELADLERWFMEASSQDAAGDSLVEEDFVQEAEEDPFGWGFVD